MRTSPGLPKIDSEATYVLAPGSFAGEYRIDEHLVDGGTASVFVATHPIIGKRVAVKVLNEALMRNPAAVEHFVLEARAVNQIRHPNIVDIFAFGQFPDGRKYLVMEFLEGETLADRAARGPMPIPEVCDVLCQLCDALDAAHAAGIAHLDLKPENVFLATTRRGTQVKLLDFGIAKLLRGAEGDDLGHFCGTPHYASPEQARARHVDHRSDVYSLGVVAYELFCGEVPYDSEVPMTLLAQHMFGVPRAPHTLVPDLPPVIEALILQMMQKDPARRPTVLDVRARLVDAARPQPRTLRDVPVPQMPWRRPWGRPVRWAAMCLTTTLVLATAGFAREHFFPPPIHTQLPSRVIVQGETARATAPAVIEAIAAPTMKTPRIHHVRRTKPRAPQAPNGPNPNEANYVLDAEGRPR